MSVERFKLSRSLLHLFFFLQKHTLFIVLGMFLAIGATLASRGLGILKKIDVKPEDLLGFFGETTETLNNTGGITNFLVLGVRGEGADSPNLSDSIIFFSLNQNTNQLTQVGIPRDLWVPSLQDRINTAYHYGEIASPGAGIRFAEASVLEILGQRVDYTVVVNFNLFKQIIDLVGGVEVNISPGFTDKEYPLPGMENALPESSRYETIVFNDGVNKLNGETALKFVRSRHSTGEEGTDFARSRRQQQIISALKDKIFSKEFLLNRSKIDKLVEVTKNNLTTNFPTSLYPALARVGLKQSGKSIKYISLSTLPDSNGVAILYNPPIEKYKGRWVLVPKDNNWKALKQYVQAKIDN